MTSDCLSHQVNKVKIRAEARDEEHEAALEAQATDQTSFPQLLHCCSFCGAQPREGDAFKCCAKCGETRYCSRACQVESWREPCAHKKSCGCRLPTPHVVATGKLRALIATDCD